MFQFLEIVIYVIFVLVLAIVQWKKRVSRPTTPSQSTSVEHTMSSVTAQGVRVVTSVRRAKKTANKGGTSRNAVVTSDKKRSVSPRCWRSQPIAQSSLPAPPPTPVDFKTDNYLSNLLTLQKLEFNETPFSEECIGDEIATFSIEERHHTPIPPIDEDFERRMSYSRNSITEGEVLLTVGDYCIYQFFAFGIEYHACILQSEKKVMWELPEELKGICDDWFLPCSRQRRKKLGIDKGPQVMPLKCVMQPPVFKTHVLSS